MNDKLIQNSRFWRSIGNSFPASVLIINRTGDIVYENTIFRNLVDVTITNLFHAIDHECLEKMKGLLVLSDDNKTIVSQTLKLKKTNEKIFYFTYYLLSLKNDLFVLILSDNTNINNELMMLHNIINTAPDPIFVKDEQHQFLYVNQAFAESLGYPVSHVLGKSDFDFFPHTESDVFHKIDRKTFKSEKTTLSEEKFTSKNDGTRDVSTKKSVFTTLTGNKILVGIIRDVTEIKEAKTYLKKHAKELKRQVEARTRQLEMKKNELEQAVEKLKILNSDLDCFAHICCHELREPLRTISSFSKLMLDEYSGKDKNIDDFLKIIHEGAARMNTLIKAILEYSTNGLSTNSMSLFSSHDLIEEVLTMLNPHIQERKAVIHYDNMPDLYADRLQILQLFQNLIHNSLKFCAVTPPVITIRATQKNKFVEVKMQDNGIGIAKRYHKEIFLPFKKFHSRSEGSMHGIGLSLCKKIVENHGGSITIASHENAGTLFTFLLPTHKLS